MQFAQINYDLFKIEELTLTDITIYGIIKSLSNLKGYCFARNKKILETLNDKISNTTLNRSLNKLEKLSLIKRETDRNFDPTKKEDQYYSERKIFILPIPVNKTPQPIAEPTPEPVSSSQDQTPRVDPVTPIQEKSEEEIQNEYNNKYYTAILSYKQRVNKEINGMTFKEYVEMFIMAIQDFNKIYKHPFNRIPDKSDFFLLDSYFTKHLIDYQLQNAKSVEEDKELIDAMNLF